MHTAVSITCVALTDIQNDFSLNKINSLIVKNMQQNHATVKSSI